MPVVVPYCCSHYRRQGLLLCPKPAKYAIQQGIAFAAIYLVLTSITDHHKNAKIDQGSKIKDQGSRIKDLGSKILCLKTL